MLQQKVRINFYSKTIMTTPVYQVIVIMLTALMLGCAVPKHKTLGDKPNDAAKNGAAFYKQAATMQWKQRDSLVIIWWEEKHYPVWLQKFSRITINGVDAVSSKDVRINAYVSQDYFSLGNSNEWARICLTPMAAAIIAKSWHCVLPTTKIVDDIYHQSKVRLDPVPMFAFRDSTPTMWHHHLIIEGQRKGKPGLIAGIKKDVVQTPKLKEQGKENKVAIYGWHKLDGKPIQPLYTGHINWYVDYSHGIRLLYETIYVNGKRMLFSNAIKDEGLHHLLCNEHGCYASMHT